MSVAVAEKNDDPVLDLESVLALHQGDERAAIVTLIENCRHLRMQLALAEATTSVGFTRGWRPTYER